DGEAGLAAFERPGGADAHPEGLLAFAAILDAVGDQCGLAAHEIFLSSVPSRTRCAASWGPFARADSGAFKGCPEGHRAAARSCRSNATKRAALNVRRANGQTPRLRSRPVRH